jgi:formiminoglutamate deiminase
VTTYWCEHAALPDHVAADVTVQVEEGRITAIDTPASPGDAIRLAGLTVAGFANCHSHAFHRALRARTQQGRGSFWTWRDQMYSLASRLDPDSYFALARAAYREMAAAGFTSVGEFHYLHHQPGGAQYSDANAMGAALIAAAGEAGLRITVLDTCYLASGIGSSPEGVQERFSDGSADAWRARVLDLAPHAGKRVVIGAAVHSVRAVPRDAIAEVAAWARHAAMPLHVHLSEQVAENDACQRAYGCTPTELLHEQGALGPRTSVVHATHLNDRDVEMIGQSGTISCFCPTTERDLGDGIGPARELRSAGSPLSLGSDSHAVVDPFEEMRALELDERLATQSRGHWRAGDLMAAGTTVGHASLGFADAGQIAVGARADLVTLDLDSPRTAGGGPSLETTVFAASAADVVHVVCDGKVIARKDDHEQVGRDLAAAIAAAWGES